MTEKALRLERLVKNRGRLDTDGATAFVPRRSAVETGAAHGRDGARTLQPERQHACLRTALENLNVDIVFFVR